MRSAAGVCLRCLFLYGNGADSPCLLQARQGVRAILEADRSRYIEWLNQDVRSEHANIVQYLQHAWAVADAGVRAALGAIAREEMRHLEWLCQAVVRLGGRPAMDPDRIDLDAPDGAALMRLDVKSEEEAIAQYRRHREAIPLPEIQQLLDRIISDEEAHLEAFRQLVRRLEAEPALLRVTGPEPAAGGAAAGAGEPFTATQAALRAKYHAILRLMHRAFTAGDNAVASLLLHHGVEEMKHMAWLADHVAAHGVRPDVTLEPALLRNDSVGAEPALQAQLDEQQEMQALLDQVAAAPEGEALASPLQRMRQQEAFQRAQLLQHLAHLRQRHTVGGFTVGSLHLTGGSNDHAQGGRSV